MKSSSELDDDVRYCDVVVLRTTTSLCWSFNRPCCGWFNGRNDIYLRWRGHKKLDILYRRQMDVAGYASATVCGLALKATRRITIMPKYFSDIQVWKVTFWSNERNRCKRSVLWMISTPSTSIERAETYRRQWRFLWLNRRRRGRAHRGGTKPHKGAY